MELFLRKALLFLGLAAFAVTAEETIDYSGHVVLRVMTENKMQLELLQSFEFDGDIDLLGVYRDQSLNKFADIHVRPQIYSQVVKALEAQKLSYRTLINDLGELQRIEQMNIALRRAMHNSKEFDFSNYHPYDEILGYLYEAANTSALVSTKVVGKTDEDRDIVQISISSDAGSNKPIIFFDCNIHAREWITAATCLWIIDQLITGYGADQEVTALIDAYDWKFVPVSNPDGYVFTWTNERLWRKNRALNDGAGCLGVDLNRNFIVGFGDSSGSSDLYCSGTYRGPAPFSEKETTTLRDLIAVDQARIKVAISVHSWGQLWLSPWGYTSDLPQQFDEMNRVMKAGVDAITGTYGTEYIYGSFADTLYLGAGVSTDYYHSEGIFHSYTIELRDLGDYGFLLPPDQILSTATETWNGLRAFINAL